MPPLNQESRHSILLRKTFQIASIGSVFTLISAALTNGAVMMATIESGANGLATNQTINSAYNAMGTLSVVAFASLIGIFAFALLGHQKEIFQNEYSHKRNIVLTTTSMGRPRTPRLHSEGQKRLKYFYDRLEKLYKEMESKGITPKRDIIKPKFQKQKPQSNPQVA